MATKTRCLTFLTCVFFAASIAHGQLIDATFTYQGQLLDGGSPANGTYDLEFRLYDDADPNIGDPVGSEEVLMDFPVTNGQLTVELNFGLEAFTGDARWLEIEVDDVVLSPRQAITAAPYSTFSTNTRGLTVDNDRVGIGTDSPERVLHTKGDAILVERDVADAAVIMRHTGNGNIQGLIGLRATGPDEGLMLITDEDQNIVMSLHDEKTGIGTQSPERVLHTVGDAILVERAANDAGVIMRNTANGQIEGQIGVRATGSDDGFLFVSDERLQRLLHLNDGYVGIGRETPVLDEVNGQSWFDVEIPETGDTVGGIFVNNQNVGERTLYGYAVDGESKAVMEYDDDVNRWALNIDDGSALAELVVQQNGNVGIGIESPSYKLDVNGPAFVDDLRIGSGEFEVNPAIKAEVNGDLWVDGNASKTNGGSWAATSDRRLKKNIRDLNGTLEKLLKLRGVTFEFKDPASIGGLPGEHTGLIAQEVEKIFPEWVNQQADGYKNVAPYGFEALTVEAFRELRDEKDAQITALQDENDQLRDRLEILEAAVANLTGK